MDDFASASMLRLLLRAMAAQGLPPPLPVPDAARVPIQHKRLVVSCIVREGGLALLLELAQQVHRIAGEPLHQALSGARDPHDFLMRWQRLERYVHASHRVLCRERGGRSLLLEHVAQADAAPLAAESVAVLGVWIGALRSIGAQALEVAIDGCVVHGDGATGAWTGRPPQCWRLKWAAMAPASAEAEVPVPPAPGRDAAPPWGGPWPWPEPAAGLAHVLARVLARDPAASPRVADAAAALGLPLRTLQRRLATSGTCFSELLGEVRVRLAAAWLARGAPTLAEIGYLCGYADQAHFTREFTRRAGMPPARYRAAAGLG